MKKIEFIQLEKIQGGAVDNSSKAVGFICGAAIGFSLSGALLPLGIVYGVSCVFSVWYLS